MCYVQPQFTRTKAERDVFVVPCPPLLRRVDMWNALQHGLWVTNREAPVAAPDLQSTTDASMEGEVHGSLRM